MNIRRATAADISGINSLLRQVLMVHHYGRPDLFKPNTKKYTDAELLQLLADDERPVFVATDGAQVLGYAFCVFQRHSGDNVLTDITTLYIDDLCVDEQQRGKGIGKALYNYVLNYAREQKCYNVTLNVWECNPAAMRFYASCGLKPYKTGMECIL